MTSQRVGVRAAVAAGVVASSLGLASGPVRADIVQATSNQATAFANNTAFGQSFTATVTEPAMNAAGIRYFQGSPTGPDVTIVAKVFAGQGYAGTPLATSASVVVPAGTAHLAWIDFAFPVIPLTTGQLYTVQFVPTLTGTTGNGFARYGLNSSSDAYPGGWQINAAGGLANPGGVLRDLAFRIIATEVPTPGAAGLLALGGLTALRRRR